jgi:hypothetical protein
VVDAEIGRLLEGGGVGSVVVDLDWLGMEEARVEVLLVVNDGGPIQDIAAAIPSDLGRP